MMYNILYKKGFYNMFDYINLINDKLNDKNNKIINNLYDNMSSYQKEIFNKLKTDKDFSCEYSLNDLVFDFDSKVIETLLNIELDVYLDFCSKNNIDNKRNGTTSNINIKTSTRNINFNRPRLRHENDFDSILIPKRTKILEDLHNNIILLYAKNNSVNDIKDLLKSMFNINLSTAYISEVTQRIADQVYEWRNKDLDPCYFVINIDCLYITLRDNKSLKSHKIPIYVAVGTKLNGHKEIVGLYLGNEDEFKNTIDSLYDKNIGESKTFWTEVFEDLKDRGVKKILFLVSDGVSGITETSKEAFPGVFHQICVVHLVRNLKKYATKTLSKEVIKDFKKVYSAPNKEIALLNRDEFNEKYKNKNTIYKYANKYFDLIMPLFDLPENIRKYIYTNNIVESVNSKIQRGFYGRGALPNKESALNIIYLNLEDLENKWKKSKVSNWDKINNELMTLYYDEIKKYLN